MDPWQIVLSVALLVIAVAMLVFIGFLLPAVFQLRLSLRRLEELMGNLNTRLPALLDNANQISADVSSITGTARKQVENVGESIQQVHGVVSDLIGFEQRMRSNRRKNSRSGSSGTLRALLRALDVFVTVMSSRRNDE